MSSLSYMGGLRWVCGILAGALLAARPVMASDIQVHGGSLQIDSELRAAVVEIGAAGTLAGRGRIQGELIVAGALEPGEAGVEDSETLSVAGTVQFLTGSRLRAHALADTAMDGLSVTGVITGSCSVVATAAPGAIPLQQALLSGLAASDYDGISLNATSSTNWMLSSSGAGVLLITHTSGDSDGDLLPDWWEDAYFLDRTNAIYDADGDADRHSNYDEYISGTDPTDGSSTFMLRSIGVSATNTLELVWTSVTGRLYEVSKASDSCTGAFTTVISDLPATPPENSYAVPAAATGHLFYQIRVTYP